MAVDKEVKKKVIEDWRAAFPQLTSFGQNKLYRITGPLIIGLELIKLPRTEEYRPHFVVYPLWKESITVSLDVPIILKEYYTKKGLQYSIPYKGHNTFFSDVLKSIKKQTPIPLEGKVSFDKLISTLEEYARTPPMSAAPNSYLHAVHLESMLELAICVGDEKKAHQIFARIERKKWDLNHFTMCGIEFQIWFTEIESKLSNKDQLILQLNTNKQDKKLGKLQRSELQGYN